eukprot:snap_masked-scaffold_2-processed-gene-24.29-mRNA-1 protein AED:1.00 eAED:1.00 QI:0/0/0/0/1/1/3/0/223
MTFFIAVFNECCAFEFDSIDQLFGCSNILANLETCFTFENSYKEAVERVQNTDLCEELKERTKFFEGVQVPIVGDPNIIPGSCANGDGQAFKEFITTGFEDILVPLGITLFFFGLLLLFAWFSALAIVYTKKIMYNFSEEQKEVDLRQFSLANKLVKIKLLPKKENINMVSKSDLSFAKFNSDGSLDRKYSRINLDTELLRLIYLVDNSKQPKNSINNPIKLK